MLLKQAGKSERKSIPSCDPLWAIRSVTRCHRDRMRGLEQRRYNKAEINLFSHKNEKRLPACSKSLLYSALNILSAEVCEVWGSLMLLLRLLQVLIFSRNHYWYFSLKNEVAVLFLLLNWDCFNCLTSDFFNSCNDFIIIITILTI